MLIISAGNTIVKFLFEYCIYWRYLSLNSFLYFMRFLPKNDVSNTHSSITTHDIYTA